MWPYASSSDVVVENVLKDIALFANIGSVTCSKRNDRIFDVEWKERKHSKKASFTVNRNGRITVKYEGVACGYRDFLSGTYMADLRHAAEQFLALVPACPNSIMARCRVEDEGDGPREGYFADVICDEITKPMLGTDGRYAEYTKLYFVRGQAGLGKTIATKELVRRQAADFLVGKSDFLYLYIDAQARALARIDEAIADTVTGFSVVFQPQAVKALARNSLLVPIIDGFDELIGSGGFADAFKSLSSFLAALNREGTVVATGRSVFYDENVLSLTADSYSHSESINYALFTVDILPWCMDDIYSFINKSCAGRISQKDVEKLISVVSAVDEDKVRDIFGKPFYLSKIVDLYVENLGHGDDAGSAWGQVSRTGKLVAKIVDEYINREVGKFTNRQGLPVLDKDGHYAFLEQLALELWWQEQRTIDNDTILVASEMTLDSCRVDPEYWPIVMGKATSHALLKSHADGDKEFESPLYYDFFLARAMYGLLPKEKNHFVRQFLSRSLLSESALEYYQEFVEQLEDDSVMERCRTLVEISIGAPSGGLIKRNAGALLSALLSARNIEGLDVVGVEFYGATFNGVCFKRVRFKECFIRDIKLYSSRLIECVFENCKVVNMVLSEASLFVDTVFDSSTFISKVVVDANTFMDWENIKHVLRGKGAKFADDEEPQRVMSDKQKGIYLLLQSFLDKASKKFQFDLDPESEYSFARAMSDPLWPELQRIMLDSGVIEKRDCDRSGGRQYLFRLAENRDRLLAALNDISVPRTPRIDRFYQMFWVIG